MAVFVRAGRRGALVVCFVLAAALVGRCAWSSRVRPQAASARASHGAAYGSRADGLSARIQQLGNRTLDWRIGKVPSVRVQGEVLLDGEPVAGADVRVAAAPGLEGTATTTDDHGRFDLGYQDPLPLHVVARHASEVGERTIDLGDHVRAGRARLDVALQPCEEWSTGRLVDREGRPLAGVPLYRSIGFRSVVTEVGRSDVDGWFAVCASDVYAGGGSLGLVHLDSPRDMEDVVLSPPFTVRGRVIRSDGTGAAGAIVDVSPQSGTGARVTARSGPDGEWSATVAPGCVALRAAYRAQYGSLDKPGPPRECFGPEPLEFCGESGDTVVAPAIVVRGNPGTTRGVVRVDGKPAPGLVVTIGYQRDLTDPSGHFSFENAAGRVEIAAHVATEMEATGADTFLEIDATQTPRIHGRVTLAGQPVRGAQVRIGYQPNYVYWNVAVTARDGSYSARVSPGTIFIAADIPGGVSTPTPEPGYIVDLPDSRIDIELGGPSSIQGSVKAPDGSAQSGVHVMLFRTPTGPFPIGETHSDARGFFQLAPRAGRYWLEVTRTWQFPGGGNQMEVVVPEGGALDLDLTVERSEGQAGAEP